jgi:hypothetical protein
MAGISWWWGEEERDKLQWTLTIAARKQSIEDIDRQSWTLNRDIHRDKHWIHITRWCGFVEYFWTVIDLTAFEDISKLSVFRKIDHLFSQFYLISLVIIISNFDLLFLCWDIHPNKRWQIFEMTLILWKNIIFCSTLWIISLRKTHFPFSQTRQHRLIWKHVIPIDSIPWIRSLSFWHFPDQTHVPLLSWSITTPKITNISDKLHFISYLDINVFYSIPDMWSDFISLEGTEIPTI